MNKSFAIKCLINCIKEKKPFSSLTERKYTYGQIASIIVQAIEEGIIEYNAEQYEITSKGEQYYKSEIDIIKEENYKRYMREDTLVIDDVYVPKYIKGVKKIEN